MGVRHRKPLSRLNKGAGKGEGSDYRSPIHQRDFASSGVSGRLLNNRHARVAQTLSKGEMRLFHYLDFYPGFIDVREQFIHEPLSETLTICLDLGINHPKQRGELFPVSTDFLVKKWNGSYIAFEAKPRSKSKLKQRHLDIDLIREVWWRARDIPYQLIDTSTLSYTVMNNIRLIQQNKWLYDKRIGIDPQDFAKHFLAHHKKGVRLSELLARVGSHYYSGLSAADLLAVLYMAIGCYFLTVDLRQQIGPFFPLNLVSTIDQSADWPWLK